MKRLLDTNTWIALTLEAHPHHAGARQWYQATPLTRGDLLFCPATEISFLRLITQERMMRSCGVAALTNEEAITYLAEVYRDPAVARMDESSGTRRLWLEIARGPYASPKVWMDAYLAALAIDLGAELVTLDRAFLAFGAKGLSVQVVNPH